ncbi:MAG: hypothetical protein WCQ99_11545, partial [Pseudomonadota bacterium]
MPTRGLFSSLLLSINLLNRFDPKQLISCYAEGKERQKMCGRMRCILFIIRNSSPGDAHFPGKVPLENPVSARSLAMRAPKYSPAEKRGRL